MLRDVARQAPDLKKFAFGIGAFKLMKSIVVEKEKLLKSNFEKEDAAERRFFSSFVAERAHNEAIKAGCGMKAAKRFFLFVF